MCSSGRNIQSKCTSKAFYSFCVCLILWVPAEPVCHSIAGRGLISNIYFAQGRCMISRVTACFLWISALSNASRHILPSNHLFLWRLRSREGVAMSVSGDARGEEREGWDGALYKQKNHSIWEWVADLNHSLLIERKQEKLLKWERTRRQGGIRRDT